MASWNDFFGTYNGQPEWMSAGSGSVASQVICYPARPYYDPPQPYYDPRQPYYCNNDGYNHLSARPPVLTMELKVPICCEGCEERVLSSLIDIDGVQSVKCDQLKQKVTVLGTASPAEVLHACKKLFKRSKWLSS